MKQNVSTRIVVLYSGIAGYVLATLQALLETDGEAQIDVVYWDADHPGHSGFELETSGPIKFHARSTLTDGGLIDLLSAQRPDIIYVSGWMDKGYLRTIRRYRRQFHGSKVVVGFDDQWEGRLRQRVGQAYFKLFYANLFDFAWVSGKPQYHYAERFGFDHEHIVGNLLSADTSMFRDRAAVSKRFVFAGRFDPVKALDQLVDAYLRLPEETQREWPLVLIGDGELRGEIESKRSGNIEILPYLQPSELQSELMRGGVACIASHHEQWGVAIHEMALLGFPLVLSSSCGAATEFLISGYNGFLFRKGNTASLHSALQKITELDDGDLESYSARSRRLGLRIDSELAAASLMSVLELSES